MVYSPYEDKRLIAAQNANINAIKPLVKGFAGGGEAVMSANRAAKGIAAPMVAARARNVDALNGYPERNTRLQAFGGKIQQDIGSGNFPKPQGFNPVTRPSYAGIGSKPAISNNQVPQIGPRANVSGLARPGAVANSPNKVSFNGTNGARGSISVMPGQENVPWTNGIEQGNGPRKSMGLGQGMTTIRQGGLSPHQVKYNEPTAGGESNTFAGSIAKGMRLRNEAREADTADIATKNGLEERGQNLTADAAARRDLLTGRGQDMDYGIQSDQNRINEDRYKVMGIGERADGEAKQYGLERQKLMDGILEASANAIPGTPEGDKVIADSRRRWSEMNPAKEQATKYTPLMGKDDLGNPVFMGGFDTNTGTQVNGGQQQAQAPQSAIDDVMKNPKLRPAFQQKYGYLPAGG